MRKKVIRIITVLIIILTILKMMYNNLLHTGPGAWSRYSKSIEHSKKVGVFIEEYAIDSLLLHNKNREKTLDTLTQVSIWKEKWWYTSPFLIWFHPVQIVERERLVLSSPLFSRSKETEQVIRVNISNPRLTLHGGRERAMGFDFSDNNDIVPDEFELEFQHGFVDPIPFARAYISKKKSKN